MLLCRVLSGKLPHRVIFMTKLVSIILVLSFVFLASLGSVFADTVCQPIYGGGQTCVTTGDILVNKTVNNPAIGQFVDNLGINDPKFSPGQQITFNIAVTNTGASTILQTKATDTLPPTLIYNSSTPAGAFDANSRTVTWVLDNLKANETRNLTVFGTIADASKLAKDVTCDPDKTTNAVAATTNTGQTSTDFATLCIQKQVVTKGGLPVFPPPKVLTTPPTGPELIPLIGLLPAGIGGWFLRRKSILKQGGEK